MSSKKRKLKARRRNLVQKGQGWVPMSMVQESGPKMWTSREATPIVDKGEALYFAYGSNLHLEQMARRCPQAEKVGHAILRNWRLAERTHADIEPHKGSLVHGYLFRITATCERALDVYEGVSGGYYKKIEVEVEDVTGSLALGLVRVLTYQMAEKRDDREGHPFSRGYALTCAVGAVDCGIPVWGGYLDRLAIDADLERDAKGFVNLKSDSDEG